MTGSAFKKFVKMESFAGVLLFFSAAVAIIIKNSSLGIHYDALLAVKLGFDTGPLHLKKDLIHWINDGLMVVFFLLVGLEIKREFLDGELSGREKAVLPAFAAAGGMIVPSLVYFLINMESPETMRGWAIPAATDIAFSLGILSLLGSRVPIGLKVFLTALAIIDDLGAILIIALFYTENLNTTALLAALVLFALLFAMNRLRVTFLSIYIILGIFLWLAVLNSGIHATIAGVLLAFTVPLGKKGERSTPLETLEHSIHPWVTYLILPVFAFTNSGLSLAGLSPSIMLEPVALGITLGLFLGKQTGVLLFSWIAVKLKIAALPEKADWSFMYAISLLTGVGFTMSLFIAGLAFSDPLLETETRLGVITGSLLSAIAGYTVLRIKIKKRGLAVV